MNNRPFRLTVNPPNPPYQGGKRRQKGSALISVLISSAIGLIVIHGVTKSLVQSKINQLILEKKDQRRGVHEYLNKIFSDYGSCLKTLEGQNLSGSASDAERSFKILAVKDSSGNTLLDFTQDPVSKDLTHAETKKRLKNFGIDRFKSMEFVYNPLQSSLGRIVLKTETKIQNFHQKENKDIVWELAGVQVEAVSGPPAGDQVTDCWDSRFLRNKCGVGISGDKHKNGGGFVQDTASVDASAYVGSGAVVCGIAQVKDTSRVEGSAEVKGKAVVQNGSRIYENAVVTGGTVDGSQVYRRGKVRGNARIEGGAKVFGPRAEVYGNAQINGAAQIKDNAKVYGDAQIAGAAQIYGNAEVYGNAWIYHGANVEISGSAKVYGNTKFYENGPSTHPLKISGGAEISGGAFVDNYAGGRGPVTISGATRIAVSGGVVAGGKILENGRVTGGGMTGGEISDNAVLSAGWMSSGKAYGDAKVNGYLSGGEIYGNAKLLSGYIMGGKVYERAEVRAGMIAGNAQVYGDAKVYGRSLSDKTHGSVGHVSGNAHVYGNASVWNSARVKGRAHVAGHANVHTGVQVYGDARVYGTAWGNTAKVYGNARIQHGASVSGGTIYGNAIVSSIVDGSWISGDVDTNGVNISDCRCERTKPATATRLIVTAPCARGGRECSYSVIY